MVLFYNGIFLSPSNRYSWMVVACGKITAIGDGTPPEMDESINLDGKLVLPGFHDSHIHVFSLGRSKRRLDLTTCSSITDMREFLQDFASRHRDEWIVGFGWNQDSFVEKRYPNREDIDLVVPNRPVVLLRACHHIGLVNSKALELLGIDENSKSPDGGIIDFKDGKPTGILREKALSVVTPMIQNSSSLENRVDILKEGIAECLKYGITSVQTNDPLCWDTYCLLNDRDQLPLSVYYTFPISEVQMGKCPPSDTVHGRVRASRVKLFTDGSLGASTAALNEPYNDGSKNESGLLLYSDEELYQLINQLNSDGWRVEIHAIGDRSAEQVIRVFKSIDLKRPVLTHGQVLSEYALKELQNSEIIVNIQPVFVGTDRFFAESRLGSRVRYSYAWKTLIELGVHVAGGSDSPIETCNPLIGMYQAIFRKKDESEEPWRDEECISFPEALSLFTERGAYAAGVEEHSGKLAVGYDADFLILSDHVHSNPHLLRTAEVLEVYKAGIRVYSR